MKMFPQHPIIVKAFKINNVFSDLISIFRFDKLSIVVDANNNNKISQIIIAS